MLILKLPYFKTSGADDAPSLPLHEVPTNVLQGHSTNIYAKFELARRQVFPTGHFAKLKTFPVVSFFSAGVAEESLRKIKFNSTDGEYHTALLLTQYYNDVLIVGVDHIATHFKLHQASLSRNPTELSGQPKCIAYFAGILLLINSRDYFPIPQAKIFDLLEVVYKEQADKLPKLEECNDFSKKVLGEFFYKYMLKYGVDELLNLPNKKQGKRLPIPECLNKAAEYSTDYSWIILYYQTHMGEYSSEADYFLKEENRNKYILGLAQIIATDHLKPYKTDDLKKFKEHFQKNLSAAEKQIVLLFAVKLLGINTLDEIEGFPLLKNLNKLYSMIISKSLINPILFNEIHENYNSQLTHPSAIFDQGRTILSEINDVDDSDDDSSDGYNEDDQRAIRALTKCWAPDQRPSDTPPRKENVHPIFKS